MWIKKKILNHRDGLTPEEELAACRVEIKTERLVMDDNVCRGSVQVEEVVSDNDGSNDSKEIIAGDDFPTAKAFISRSKEKQETRKQDDAMPWKLGFSRWMMDQLWTT